jgi:hypothetical protein
MVSNLLSPYSSTLAMQAQNGSGGCGKLTVSGSINAEDSEATEHKTDQMALGSSPGLAHDPKMGGDKTNIFPFSDFPTFWHLILAESGGGLSRP